MIDRILKNWKTTVLGLAILITCFILVFMEKSTLTEVSVFICGGFFVLFSKDSMLRKKGPVSVIIRVFTPFCQLPAIQVLYNKHRTYSQGHHHNQGFHSFPDRNSGRYCPDHIGFDRLRYGLPRSAPVWPF